MTAAQHERAEIVTSATVFNIIAIDVSSVCRRSVPLPCPPRSQRFRYKITGPPELILFGLLTPTGLTGTTGRGVWTGGPTVTGGCSTGPTPLWGGPDGPDGPTREAPSCQYSSHLIVQAPRLLTVLLCASHQFQQALTPFKHALVLHSAFALSTKPDEIRNANDKVASAKTPGALVVAGLIIE